MLNCSCIKIGRLILLLGVALLAAGYISNNMIKDFDKNKVMAPAVICGVEKGGFLTNGEKVSLLYFAEGKERKGTLPSNEMREYVDRLKEKGMTLRDAAYSAAKINIYYHSERPGSIKYENYENPSKNLFTWGWIFIAAFIMFGIVRLFPKKRRTDGKK